MLRGAAVWGHVFNSHNSLGSRVSIAPATAHPSSSSAVENHDEESGSTGSGTEAQMTSSSAVLVGPDTSHDAQMMRASALSAELSYEDTETRPSRSIDELEDEASIFTIGLQTASGELFEVVSSIKVGCRISVDQIIDHLKKDKEHKTCDLRQRLELMSANSVEIRTAKIPIRVCQVAAARGKWGDTSQVLGKLDEVDKMRHLMPCIPSQEADDIRRVAGHHISSSTPIFVMYLFEIPVSGTCLT